jgi:hypothetical protein
MGINTNGLRFLLYAKSIGIDFTKTAMIGRQTLNLSFDKFCKVLTAEFGHKISPEKLKAIYNAHYADDLLRYLGAAEVSSFDYSDYEGATHTHDFNKPVSEEHHGLYTAVIEGGSLEHIFNFPTAIKNCMQMVKVGGHYLGISPANNYMGHGFYQFSPELYFRIFSRQNGFCVRHILLHEGRETPKWLRVTDPDEVKRRVGFKNSKPILLLILAEKLDRAVIFSDPPMQSDYVSVWGGTPARPARGGRLSALKRLFPNSLKDYVKTMFGLNRNPTFFKPFRPSDPKAGSE